MLRRGWRRKRLPRAGWDLRRKKQVRNPFLKRCCAKSADAAGAAWQAETGNGGGSGGGAPAPGKGIGGRAKPAPPMPLPILKREKKKENGQTEQTRRLPRFF